MSEAIRGRQTSRARAKGKVLVRHTDPHPGTMTDLALSGMAPELRSADTAGVTPPQVPGGHGLLPRLVPPACSVNAKRREQCVCGLAMERSFSADLLRRRALQDQGARLKLSGIMQASHTFWVGVDDGLHLLAQGGHVRQDAAMSVSESALGDVARATSCWRGCGKSRNTALERDTEFCGTHDPPLINEPSRVPVSLQRRPLAQESENPGRVCDALSMERRPGR